jgi:hypothetical protein
MARSRIIKLRQPELLNAQNMTYGWKKYLRSERKFLKHIKEPLTN